MVKKNAISKNLFPLKIITLTIENEIKMSAPKIISMLLDTSKINRYRSKRGKARRSARIVPAII